MARTQVRLGLVVEGGVSLAVWMSGVAHEIDVLRRAGSPEREPFGATGETEALARWRTLCDDLGVDVVVDIVSGTSAGGINGALLACAAATGRPLPGLRTLWVSAAQLARDKLLRPAGTDALPSLLDGRFFEGQLRSVVAEALGATGGGSPHGGRYPVTLLTTATALGPATTVWEDSSGGRFQVADHRRLYRFRNDPSQLAFAPPDPAAVPADPFELFVPADPDDLRPTPQAVAAVTRAARATASFPAAFEPVQEHDADADLRPYRVQRRATGTVLVDGGVLANTPIEPLLDEIARRPVVGTWRRVIGYITANDGLAGSTVPAGGDSGRRVATEWFPVLTSTLRMGSEASFRHGVEALAQHGLDAERLIAIPEALFEQALSTGQPDEAAVAPLYGRYRQNRVEGGVLDAYLARLGDVTARPVSPRRMEDVRPDDAPLWVPPEPFGAALDPDRWLWGTAVADRSVRMLVRHLNVWSTGRPEVDASPALARLSPVLAAVAAVRDFIADRVAAAPDDDGRTLLRAVNAAIEAASGPAVLARLMARAATAYAEARTDLRVEPEQVLRAALVTEVVTQAAAGRIPFSRPARFDVIRMGPDVASPVVRAPGARQLGEWKLYGRQIAHFGAFGRPEWRDHDFVWGRLDAAAHLVRILARVSGSPLRTETTARNAVALAQDAVLQEEKTDPAEMAAALATLARLDVTATLDAIRATPAGRQAADDTVSDVLRMLRVRAPGTPAGLSTAGDWASAVLARSLPAGQPAGLRRRVLRAVATVWPRPRFWRWVGTPKSRS